MLFTSILKTTMINSSTEFIFISNNFITQLLSINKNKIIKKINSDKGKVDNFDFIDITNIRSVQNQFLFYNS